VPPSIQQESFDGSGDRKKSKKSPSASRAKQYKLRRSRKPCDQILSQGPEELLDLLEPPEYLKTSERKYTQLSQIKKLIQKRKAAEQQSMIDRYVKEKEEMLNQYKM